jgi:SAM-dependent methyltransferase
MDKNIYLRMSEQDNKHWWFVARRRILWDQISSLRLPSGARVLEAGTGPGGNLEMLSEFGALEGFEPDDCVRQIASARSGIVIRPGALPGNIGYEPGSFDLIATLDVIEHIEADRESVRSLARLLRPGARLIITVPAYERLWSAYDERHHHKRRYTRPKVRRLVEEFGLEVERCTHFNTILLPLIVVTRLFKKLAGLADRPDDEMPSPLVKAILLRIFSVERYLLRHLSLQFGVSILCIARRR